LGFNCFPSLVFQLPQFLVLSFVSRSFLQIFSFVCTSLRTASRKSIPLTSTVPPQFSPLLKRGYQVFNISSPVVVEIPKSHSPRRNIRPPLRSGRRIPTPFFAPLQVFFRGFLRALHDSSPFKTQNFGGIKRLLSVFCIKSHVVLVFSPALPSTAAVFFFSFK